MRLQQNLPRNQMDHPVEAGTLYVHQFKELTTFQGNLYGTSIYGVRELVRAGLQPVLSPHYQVGAFAVQKHEHIRY